MKKTRLVKKHFIAVLKKRRKKIHDISVKIKIALKAAVISYINKSTKKNLQI